MKEEIAKIKENSLKEIKERTDLKTLNDLRVKYLGKKGELTRRKTCYRKSCKSSKRWTREFDCTKRARA